MTNRFHRKIASLESWIRDYLMKIKTMFYSAYFTVVLAGPNRLGRRAAVGLCVPVQAGGE